MEYQVYRIVSAVGGHDIAVLRLEADPETAVGDLKKKLHEQRPDLCPPWVHILREGQLLEDTVTLQQLSLPLVGDEHSNSEMLMQLVYTIDVEMLFTEFPASGVMLARSLGTMGESARPYLLALLGVPSTETSIDEIVADRFVYGSNVKRALARLQNRFCAADDLEGFKSALAPIVVEMLVAGVIDAAVPFTWSWFGLPIVPLLASCLSDADAELCTRVNAAHALGHMNCDLEGAEGLLLEIAQSSQESSLRVATITALGNVCSTAKNASAIVKLTQRELDESVRNAATHAVTMIGTTSQHRLVRSAALRSMARR